MPKQFLRLVTDRTLLQDTLLRLGALPIDSGSPIVIGNESHRFLIGEQMRELSVEAGTIVLEPAGRNTAPAVGLAALLAEAKEGADSIMAVLPADHVIADVQAFADATLAALEAAEEGRLVTFGVVPTRAESGYGYIRKGLEQRSWSEIRRFVEKPDTETAQRYVDSGEYLWNSGMFVFPVRDLLQEMERYAPEVLSVCREVLAHAQTDGDFLRLESDFLKCPSLSIDYAVMEKTDRAAVVPLDAGWNDVGSWGALHELANVDPDGNVARGDVVLERTRDSYVVSSSRTVAALGLHNLLVVETPDAVLVCPLDQSQDIKHLAERMADGGKEY